MDFEAPINAGHRFVVEAENYEDNENWLKAAEAHSKAAEQFEIAIQDSVEDEAIKTLRLLSSNHQKKASDLNRKAERLIKAASKNRMHHMVGSRAGLRNALSASQQQQQQYHPHYHSSHEFGSASTSNSNSIISRLAGIHASTVDSGDIGESYTLLPNIERQELDFLKFFESVNQLVEKVCNPAVAFTSAPLNENDIPIPDEVDVDESVSSLHQSHNNTNNAMMMDSYFIVTDPKDESMVTTIQKQLGSLSINRATVPNTTDNCKLENEKLRIQLAHLKKRLKSLQMSAEENNMLKSSVLQFRDDVHKQAKRIMQSHHESSMRASSSLIAGGGPNIMYGSRHSPLAAGNSNGNHDLASRLRDLEEENKQLRLHNEKQKVLVNRYKERWEMLKANAKKRRASSSLSTAVSNVITEELEEEIL